MTKNREQIFHKPNSFTSQVLEFIEYMIGATYIAFSRKTLMKKLYMNPSYEGDKLLSALFSLERNEFIKKVDRDRFRLTQKGVKRINFSRFFRLSLDKNKKDGLWRVIIFDIPEKQKVKRELLRQKLKEFDFKMMQKSVFISPYVCEKEIKDLCEILNLRDEVKILLVKKP